MTRPRTVRRAVAAGLKAELVDAKKSGDAERVEKVEESLDAMRRRPCRRSMELYGVPPCRRTFVPPLSASRRVTQTTCSSECSMLLMAQRFKWEKSAVAETVAKMLSGAADPERAGEVKAERLRRLHAARPPRRAPVAVEGAFKLLTDVAYAGGAGSRGNVPVGTRGVVTKVYPPKGVYGLYYGVRFAGEARDRVVSAKFLEEVR